MEISYSAIKTYQSCPWKYKLLYLDNWHTSPNPAISLGHSIHKTLESFYSQKERSLDQLFEDYNKSWNNEGFLTAQEAQQYYEKGQVMLEKYWNSNRDLGAETVSIERQFNILIGQNNLRGTVDRIDRHSDNEYEIIDYKTHAELWDQNRVDNDLQLTLYSYACKEIGFNPVILSYYFLAHNRKISTHRTEKQIEEALDLVEKITEKIQMQDFPANTAACVKCDFKNKCKYSPVKGQDK